MLDGRFQRRGDEFRAHVVSWYVEATSAFVAQACISEFRRTHECSARWHLQKQIRFRVFVQRVEPLLDLKSAVAPPHRRITSYTSYMSSLARLRARSLVNLPREEESPRAHLQARVFTMCGGTNASRIPASVSRGDRCGCRPGVLELFAEGQCGYIYVTEQGGGELGYAVAFVEEKLSRRRRKDAYLDRPAVSRFLLPNRTVFSSALF